MSEGTPAFSALNLTPALFGIIGAGKTGNSARAPPWEIWMRSILLATVTAILGMSTVLAGEDNPGRDTMAAFSPLFAGMLGGAICNKEIDREAGSEFVKGKTDERTFTVDQVVFLNWFSVTQQTFQINLGGIPHTKRENLKYCANMMSAFGPNGTTIPGLLKP
jgi:hypothetical protein